MPRHRRIVLAAGFAASVAFGAGAQAQPSPLERGRYLVDAVMACDGCHTPRPRGNFDMSRRFSGGSQTWDEHAFTVKGSNITPDRETGIGSWSAADFKRLMVEGRRPNGVTVAPQMPFAFYKILTPGDLDAVTAYVLSMQPVRNEVQPPAYKAAMTYLDIPGGEKPYTDADLNDPIKRGFYLATIAHCMECHSRTPDYKPDYKGWWGRGGSEMKGPFGTVKVSNITSHKEKGVGAWSDAELRRALVEGKGRDGRAFKTPMARHIYFAKMTDQDINAIIAWMRTIPPAE
jgi:mono/diheme cytochrome c family protein